MPPRADRSGSTKPRTHPPPRAPRPRRDLPGPGPPRHRRTTRHKVTRLAPPGRDRGQGGASGAPALPCTCQSQPAAPGSRTRTQPWRPGRRAATPLRLWATREDEPSRTPAGPGWEDPGCQGRGKEPRSAHRARVAASATSVVSQRASAAAASPRPPRERRWSAPPARPLSPGRTNQRESGNTKSRLPGLLGVSFASVKIGELR